jgi:HEAT repeat protein
MQQKSETRRENSRHALKQIQTDAFFDFMLAFLCARDLAKETRTQISRLLVFFGGGVARRLMERLADESDAQARKLLSDALMHQGAAAVSVLIEYLEDERWYVVRNAVAILGELRAQTAVGHFQPLLGHLDVRVRRETMRALTRIGGLDVVDIFLQIVQKGDPDLRPHALLSLGAMKNPAAVPTLLQIIEQPDPWVKMSEIKKEAIRALGEIGSIEAVPALLAILRHRKLWRRDQFNELRAAAAISLGDIGHVKAAEALMAATEDRSTAVARAAAQALKQLRKG